MKGMSFPLSNYILFIKSSLVINFEHLDHTHHLTKSRIVTLHDLNNYEKDRNEIKEIFWGCTLLQGLIDALIFCVKFLNEH